MKKRVRWSRCATLRQLLIFHAIAATGSAGGAARRLRLSQPAVSHALTKLETALGVTLFDRMPQGSTLTADGAILQARVLRMQGYIHAAVLAVLGEKGTESAERCATSLTSTQTACHLAVATTGSFQAAAVALGVSTPAVHRAAHELEMLLSAQLYRRSGRRLEVTGIGRRLANGLHLALTEIDQAQDDVEAAAGAGAPRVRIGVLPLTPASVVGRSIGQMITDHPDLDLRIEEGPYDRLAPQLRDGRLDVIFGAIRPERADPDFLARALVDDPYVIVARAAHPLASRGHVAAAELATQTWLVPPSGSPRRKAIDDLLAALPRPPRTVLETSSEAMMIAILLASNCLTLGPRSQVQSSAPMGNLRRIRSEEQTALRTIGFTLRADWLPTRAQKQMLEIVEEHLLTISPADW